MAINNFFYYLIRNKDVLDLSNKIVISKDNVIVDTYYCKEYKIEETSDSILIKKDGQLFKKYDKLYKAEIVLDLPYSDNSKFISGMLNNNHLDENTLKQFNYIQKYRKSLYELGQIVLEDHDPKTDHPFKLSEKGFYKITLSGAGYNETGNHTKFAGEWKKKPIKDDLTILKDFNWRRTKYIDEEFFFIWEGTYSYAENVLILSLDEFGYCDAGNEQKTSTYKSYYGIVVSPVEYIGSLTANLDNKNITYAVFFDNEKIDLQNIYDAHNVVHQTGTDVTDIKDIIKIGGRGQLLNTTVRQPEYNENIKYNVGNSGAKSYIGYYDVDGETLKNTFETDNGNDTDNLDNFGGIGGNIFQDSFDFYRKQTPDNGYVKIQYIGYDDTCLRTIELDHVTDDIYIVRNNEIVDIDNNAITVEGNNPNTLIAIAGEMTEIYLRITDRTKELDLETSTLDDIPLRKVIKEKIIDKETGEEKETDTIKEIIGVDKFEMEKLDNFRRIIRFKVPYKSSQINNPTKFVLDLKTTDRKFYFALMADNNIKSIKFGAGYDKKEYKKEYMHEGLIDEDIYFTSGQTLDIEIEYNNDNYTVNKRLLQAYLGDCIDTKRPENPSVICPSNNYKQLITNFKMPERDVLLFLKTEKLYTLKVFFDEKSTHLLNVVHNNENHKYNDPEYPKYSLPIIIKHIWDDPISLEVSFTKDNESKFTVIDTDFLEKQLATIDVEDRIVEDTHYTGNQIMSFFMPDDDLTLYIKEKNFNQKLTFKTNIDPEILQINKIVYIHEDNSETELVPYNTEMLWNKEQEENKNIINEMKDVWTSKTIYVIPNIKITIKIEFINPDGNKFIYIDDDFLISQFQKIRISKKSDEDKNNDNYNGDQNLYIEEMPYYDLNLYLKTIDPRSSLIIKRNDRQLIDRPILSVIIKTKNYNFEEIDFSKEYKILADDEVNLYIKYTDIYQHLDKEYIWNQIPLAVIDKAGDNIDFSALIGD